MPCGLKPLKLDFSLRVDAFAEGASAGVGGWVPAVDDFRNIDAGSSSASTQCVASIFFIIHFSDKGGKVAVAVKKAPSTHMSTSGYARARVRSSLPVSPVSRCVAAALCASETVKLQRENSRKPQECS